MVKYFNNFNIIITNNELILLFENSLGLEKGLEIINKFSKINKINKINKNEWEIETNIESNFLFNCIESTEEDTRPSNPGSLWIMNHTAKNKEVKNYVEINTKFDCLDWPLNINESIKLVKYLNGTSIYYGEYLEINFKFYEVQFGYMLLYELIENTESYHDRNRDLYTFELWGDECLLERFRNDDININLYLRMFLYKKERYKIIIAYPENLLITKSLLIYSETDEFLQNEEFEYIAKQFKNPPL